VTEWHHECTALLLHSLTASLTHSITHCLTRALTSSRTSWAVPRAACPLKYTVSYELRPMAQPPLSSYARCEEETSQWGMSKKVSEWVSEWVRSVRGWEGEESGKKGVKKMKRRCWGLSNIVLWLFRQEERSAYIAICQPHMVIVVPIISSFHLLTELKEVVV
jgi:hypothetical protein